jgi:hypothetical protein
MKEGTDDDEKDILSMFTYEKVNCTVHRDVALLPADYDDHRAFNWIWYPDDDKSEITLHSNHLNSALGRSKDTPLCLQTVNPQTSIDPKETISVSMFERVLVTPLSNAGLSRLPSIQGRGGLWYAGSWASRGIPLLESAVVAARRVAADLDCYAPWADDGMPLPLLPLAMRDQRTARLGASFSSPTAQYKLHVEQYGGVGKASGVQEPRRPTLGGGSSGSGSGSGSKGSSSSGILRPLLSLSPSVLLLLSGVYYFYKK